MSADTDKILWQKITTQIADEWQLLPVIEQDWIAAHALRIITFQQEMHQLFLAVDGAMICRDCAGDCCGHGRFHPNLVNLLACLVSDTPFPEPQFDQDCPYFGSQGCCFPPGLRPYNCITFICEKIENALSSVAQAEFYRLEREVRAEYELFRERYAGAGMNGILTRGAALPAYLVRQ